MPGFRHALRARLKRTTLYNFNVVNRDKWIAMQAARLEENAKVLDVGAGSCPYRGLFAHCDYRAQDFVGLRSDQLRGGGYGSVDIIADAGAIPVATGTLDAVVCTEVIEHLIEPARAIKEFGRVLRSRGRVMLTAPLGSGIHQEPYHYYGGFTPYWYESVLGEAGFTEIQVEANAGSMAFYAQESLRFIRETWPKSLKAPVVVRVGWAPIWVMLVPLLAGAVPLLAHWLDRYDDEKRFTVGYHVTATKT